MDILSLQIKKGEKARTENLEMDSFLGLAELLISADYRVVGWLIDKTARQI